jgi:molybdopterin converting factor subunit 1
MQVQVLFFGKLRELFQSASKDLDLPAKSSVEDLFRLCVATHPEFAQYRSSVVASRNREFVPWTAMLEPGDEVAFLPPVSGG